MACTNRPTTRSLRLPATVLQPEPAKQQQAKPYQEMFTRELRRFIRKTPKNTQDGTDARIELQRRFALPVACFMLALVGIPLGASSRKGGRSAGYVWAIFLAFFCYYLSYITLTSLAQRSHSISVELASWLPNAGFAIVGIVMIARMDVARRSGLARHCAANDHEVDDPDIAWIINKPRVRCQGAESSWRCSRYSRQLRAVELPVLLRRHPLLSGNDVSGVYVL